MYMDVYVASGLIIVGLTCAMFVFVGYFGYRHFKKDVAEHPGE